MFLKSNERSLVNGKNHINGIENFFSKRARPITSKRSEAKHKSCDLRCYCLLKGYERRVKQSRRGYAKHRLSKFKRIFSSVATVATAEKLSKEKFLLHLKGCALLLLHCVRSFSRRSYERSEVEFRYNTKTTQENLYQKLLKLIRGLIGSDASRS